MAVYARADLAYVSVSEAHGGCGQPHSRPVENGVPVQPWRLDCEPCADHYRSDPHFSSTDVEIPLTYDEDKAREKAEKSGKLDRENQLAAAMIELGKLGNLPEAIAQALTSLAGGSAVAGQIECPAGHAQPAGQKFCGQCGAPMHSAPAQPALPAAQKAAEMPAPPVPGQKLRRLRDARLDELQSLARLHGSDPDGTRADLIARLSAAGVTSADLARLPVAA